MNKAQARSIVHVPIRAVIQTQEIYIEKMKLSIERCVRGRTIAEGGGNFYVETNVRRVNDERLAGNIVGIIRCHNCFCFHFATFHGATVVDAGGKIRLTTLSIPESLNNNTISTLKAEPSLAHLPISGLLPSSTRSHPRRCAFRVQCDYRGCVGRTLQAPEGTPRGHRSSHVAASGPRCSCASGRTIQR